VYIEYKFKDGKSIKQSWDNIKVEGGDFLTYIENAKKENLIIKYTDNEGNQGETRWDNVESIVITFK
jgi:hypothetical protein